ncbi:MAG: D-alanine--poly(phosphoribitol) ligase subunit DltA [Candidatus Omnitrophota bacterium]
MNDTKKIDKKNIDDITSLTPMQEGMLFHYLKSRENDYNHYHNDDYVEQLSLTLSFSPDETLTDYCPYFQRAWDGVVDNNGNLRTCFRWEEVSQPTQIILKKHKTPFIFHDFSEAETNAVNRLVEEVKAKDRAQKFDLTEVPFRVTVCKRAPQKYEMVISNHHILYDGWSNGIILTEFFSAFHELIHGKEPEKRIKTNYKEYVHWIRSGHSENETVFWRSYLEDVEDQTELPIKRKKNDSEDNGDHCVYHNYLLRFSSLEADAFDSFVKTHRVTLASLFYGAWGIILQRINNSGDVIMGTTVSGRPSAIKGIEDMVGLFINTIPLRVRSKNDDETAEGFLMQLNQELQEREKFETSSLVEIKEWSSLGVGQELFDHIVVMENYPLKKALRDGFTGGLTVDAYAMNEHTHYDLTIGIMMMDGIDVEFTFNSELFDVGSVERMAGHLRNVLTSIIHHPEMVVRDIDLLRDEDKQKILDEFNGPELDFPCIKTIYELFENQVEKTPDRIASGGPLFEKSGAKTFGYLTYCELNEQSNRIAGTLIEKGVIPGNVVGIMVERSMEMIIGILGILKTGAAYLPIDPDYPQERVDYILKDSQAKFLLATEDTEFTEGVLGSGELGSSLVLQHCYHCYNKRFDFGHENSVGADPCVCPQMDCSEPGLRTESGAHTGAPLQHSESIPLLDHLNLSPSQPLNFLFSNPLYFSPSPSVCSVTSVAKNIAYIIYTSGTTGKPKGVMVDHSALINRLYWVQHRYALTDRDVVLQAASFVFDVSVCEIFRWILPGARLILLPPGGEKDPSCIVNTIEKHGATTADFVPSMVHLILDDVENRKPFNDVTYRELSTLRWVFTGVETVGLNLVKRFNDTLNRINRTRLINAYGPTESTVDVTYYDCTNLNSDADVVPIGKPMANVRIYILDRYGNIQPVGVRGELCIAGKGLARGYLNRPDLTMERFPTFLKKGGAKNFWFDSFGERVYMTGDHARWLDDGNIEFLGRVDRQVKIRGFRVELGEIESRLLSLDAVKEAIVIDRELRPGEKHLCAYIVPAMNGAIDRKMLIRSMTETLEKQLPGYMVPAHFVLLERIPLTLSGKIDRNALPQPEVEVNETYIAPRNQIEQTLAAIWSRILHMDLSVIGIDTGFFHLGGHSLKAMALVSSIHKELNIRIPISEIFQSPTIRGLAATIQSIQSPQSMHAMRDGRSDIYTSIQPVEKKEFYPLSSAQKRMFMLQQFEKENIAYNMSEAVELEGELDLPRFEDAFRKLIERHENLRTSFHMINDEPVQIVHENLNFQIEYISIETPPPKNTPQTKVFAGWAAPTADSGLPAILKAPVGNHKDDIYIKTLDKESNIHLLNNCWGRLQPLAKSTPFFFQPFDLSRAPLMRVGLVEESSTRRLLLVGMHHIISDGTSVEVFIKDFMALYQGEALPLLSVQYKEFTEWQNRMKQEDVIQRQEAYWMNKFAILPPVLDMPLDFPRPARQRFEGGILPFEIDIQTTAALNALARKEDATLFMVLLSIFNVLLWKLSGTKTVVVGSPIAGRRHTDLEPIMGMFVNTLALQNHPDGEKTFPVFLRDVKRKTLAAFENQDYQFEDLVDKVGVERDASRNPLFDVLFVLQNMETTRLEIPGLTLRFCDYDPDTSQFDLFLSAEEKEQRLVFKMGYCTHLFRKETVARFTRYFVQLIDSVVKETENEVSLFDLDMLPEDEKELILEIFNHPYPDADAPPDRVLHEWFEDQVEQTPEHIAVMSPSGESITYRELNALSNRLARHLQHQGVTPGSVVAVLMERSIRLIAGILAILKTGAAYLPIDPDYPAARIFSILEDCEIRYVLINDSVAKSLPFMRLKNINMKTNSETPLVTATRTPIQDLDRLPWPDRTAIDHRKYRDFIGLAPAKNTVTLQTSRGCPFNCLYCHKIWPKKQISRSAENIFDELSAYYQSGLRRFVFVDDIFNLDKANSSRLMQKILDHRFKVQMFFPNGLRGDILTKDFIDLMVEAGTVNICLALESASPRIQKLLRKNLDLDKFRDNALYIAQKYPHVIFEMELMHGFPTETEAEALATFDFLKDIHWVHFPNLNILKIYPNTEMYRVAVENGITPQAIDNSTGLAYHELPETLPFPKTFTRQFQARFMDEYFFLRERILKLLPYQLQVLTEEELAQKYDSYLPLDIKSFDDVLNSFGVSRHELEEARQQTPVSISLPKPDEFLQPVDLRIAFPNKKESFPDKHGDASRFHVLLLDLSQYFSADRGQMLYDMVEEPLGLMCLSSYLENTFEDRVSVKIAKSRIDFDNYDELKQLIETFKPNLIGLRTLSYYKDFFHRTVSMIRGWGIDTPIISGGPYATSDYGTALQDPGIDLVVLGEGEVTLAQLVERMMAHSGKLPPDEILQTIEGIALYPKSARKTGQNLREIIRMDSIDSQLNRYEPENLRVPVSSDALLYLISTSGSTGKPKSVMLRHRNLANLMHFQSSVQHIDFSRVLQFASIGFDASAQEIFSTLLYGGTLYLLTRDMRTDVMQLFAYIREHEIEVLFMPPAFLRFMFSDAQAGNDFPRCIKHIMAAGEQLIVTEAFRSYLKENHVTLHNHYGPAEAHVVTTLTLAPGAPIPDRPNIGKPIMNTGIYILDEKMNPKPLGVSGELYIAGANVGPGYYKKPELTEERFMDCLRRPTFLKKGGTKNFWFGKECFDSVNDNFDNKGVGRYERLYRTGDLARWLPDGSIEFLGRVDTQVKIRSFRIELEEIERAINNLSSVKEAVVIDRMDAGGDKYLCAYVVATDDFDPAEAGDRLSATLPDYMVPAYFVPIHHIPLNVNGKVDRKALPEPVLTASGGNANDAPQSDIEKRLANLWSDVLGIGEGAHGLGIDADFFKLGGHSLKATILISRIHKEFDVKVTLGEIFENSTIRKLAEKIAEAGQAHYSAIPFVEEKEYYALSSAQKRLYILHAMDPETPTYNMPEAVWLNGEINKEKLQEIFRTLIQRHESLRTSFIEVNHEPVQRIHHNVEFNISFLTEHTGNTEGEKKKVRREEEKKLSEINSFIRSFDLIKAPLMRVGLIKENDNKYLLIVDMHHIVSDGVSSGIIIRDFVSLMNDEPLAPVTVRYRDFVEWQNRARLSDEINEMSEMKKQEAYWLGIFEGEVPVLELPYDFPRPATQSYEGSAVHFHLAKEQTQILKQLALTENVTLYMVLLGVFNIVLSKLSGSEDIVIGSDIAGRKHADLSNVVGMFVNTLALRNFPHAEKTFHSFLQELKQRTTDAFANPDFPFEDLVEKVSVVRDAGRNPVFDVMFTFTDDALTGKNRLIGHGPLIIEPFEIENHTSKFDISLYGLDHVDGLSFTIEYCTALFKPQTMERYAGYFSQVIQAVSTDPAQEIGAIDMIPPEEKKQLLHVFNNTKKDIKDIDVTKTYSQLFEDQVRRTPDRMAACSVETLKTLRATSPQVSYDELNRRSEILAGELKDRGVGLDIIVGIKMERSIELMIGILGTFKAGGVYLPIDPDYPQERVDYMLNDSGARLLVLTEDTGDTGEVLGSSLALQHFYNYYNTRFDFVDENSVGADPRVCPSINCSEPRLYTESGAHTGAPLQNPVGADPRVCPPINCSKSGLRTEPGAHAGAPLQNSESILDHLTLSSSQPLNFLFSNPLNLSPSVSSVSPVRNHSNSYIIYTSGTTGKPKGVMIHHAGMINHLYAKIDELSITSNDIIAQTASACFDISIWQFLAAPLKGGKTLIIDKQTVLEPQQFLNTLRREKVTILESVPSMMNAFLDYVTEHQDNTLNYLRWMIPTGEALSPSLTRKWFTLFPDIKLVNAYGPTEASDDVTHYIIDQLPSESQTSIPIGKPLQNLHIYILDKQLNLCPIGVKGEIAVAGIGLATGYLNRVELTHERFKDCLRRPAFCKKRGKNFWFGVEGFGFEYRYEDKKIYLTGDVGYWREDGNIECLGRIDRQVKIRGFRIEPGEIETRILQFPDIKEAMVIPYQNKDLCAYLVSIPQNQTLSLTHLRDFLQEKLPNYMIPTYFVTLDRFPLTANGKIDVNALPKPETAVIENNSPLYNAPTTAIEKTLIEIWASLLNIAKEAIGTDADFFRLGGNSLNAVQLVNAVHKQLNIKIPIQQIFQFPTLSALAAAIEKNEKNSPTLLHAIVRAPDQPTYELSYSQKRLWVLHKRNPNSPEFNMPERIRLQSEVNPALMRQTLEYLTARHESLRTCFQEIDGNIVQKIELQGSVDFEMIDISTLHGEELEAERNRLAMEANLIPFDITGLPLLRVRLIQCASAEFDLVLIMHHLITDGWSMQILLNELQRIYDALEHGTEIHLEPLPIRYADVAIWQNQRLKDDHYMKPALEFWNDQFGGIIPTLRLPYDFSRSELKSKKSRAYRTVLDTETLERLRAISLNHNASFFMIVLAGFYLLISRLIKENDLLIAIPAGGRQHDDLKNIIGLFANTILLRMKIPGSQDETTFLQFLETVRTHTLNVLEYQSYPMEAIFDQLKMKYPETFVFFNMENTGPFTRETLIDLKTYHIDEIQDAKFDIVFYLVEYRNGLDLMCHYLNDLFLPQTVEKIMTMYIKILREIAETPEKPLRDYQGTQKQKRKLQRAE